MEMDEVFKNLPLAEQKKMLDHLAKLPDVRCLSSEEQEKYDESIKAVDDLSLIHISEPTRQYCQSRMPSSS